MGYHRTDNYWEPTYDGQTFLDHTQDAFEWGHLFTDNGPFRKICDWTTYQKEGHKLIINKVFSVCDFSGDISSITFRKCVFKNCFWNRYVWGKIKFQECKFEKCSFSFAHFKECQFFNCSFYDIGLSGNETIFKDCIIDSKKLITAAYTNLDNRTLESHNKTPFTQTARLSKTKAEISQKLYRQNNQFSEFYYPSIEIAVLQEIIARIYMRFYVYRFTHWYDVFILFYVLLRTAIDVLELIVMFLAGKLFGWGQSFFKCVCGGLLIIVLFSLYYQHIKYVGMPWQESFMRAFDLTVIAGYSKYPLNSIQVAELLNLGVGILWYSIAIPAITSKLTKQCD